MAIAWALAGLLLLSLAGCGAEPGSGGGASPVALSDRMGGVPDPGFARALAPREFAFPADHGAHPDYATEWWYFTGNLATDDGRHFGYQLTLFRVGLEPGAPFADSSWRTHQLYMGHVAVSDIAERRHHSAERFSRAAAGLAGAKTEPLRVWLGPWSISGGPDSTFPLTLRADTPDVGLALTIGRGDRPMVLQGDNGLSRKGAAPGNASYYYSYTRLPTQGELRIGGQTYRVGGDSWFDREWSSSALADDQAGWDWFAVHLDDGRDLMLYRMRGVDGEAQRFSKGVVVYPGGDIRRLEHSDFRLEPARHWSPDARTHYPVGWRLVVPAEDLRLDVTAAFDDQEMDHAVRYWEGAVEVGGSHRGRGYLELSGYASSKPSSDTE